MKNGKSKTKRKALVAILSQVITGGGDGPKKPILIVSGAIKDDFCNFSYQVTDGIGLGNDINVKGKGIVMDDMKDAFQKFNVHMAVIDDCFKHSDIEIADVDTMHDHDLAFLFTCTGFKMKGAGDNESVILVGTKYVSGGGRIALETPRIYLDEGSSYKWYNELKTAVDRARLEVELYLGGKYIEPETDEEKPDPAQMTIFSAAARADTSEDPEGTNELSPASLVIEQDFADAQL